MICQHAPVLAILRSILKKLGLSVKRRRKGIHRGTDGLLQSVDADNLMESIHGCDIYERFDFKMYPRDITGWGGESPAFSELVLRTRPKLIIEVGTWKGASAITMAKALEAAGIDSKILCIDTWLGALEFRMDQTDPARFQSLQCLHGFPQVYFQFLANVCHAGQRTRIVPFPIDSSNATLWLLSHGVKADLVYIDGSHEEEAVYQDLLDYSALLSPGGIIFGDDWEWSGVQSAVLSFAKEESRRISHLSDKWILE